MTRVPETSQRPGMFAGRPPAPRSPLAAAVSLCAHATLVVAIAAFAWRGVTTPGAQGRQPMRFVRLSVPPSVPAALMLPPLARPRPPNATVEVGETEPKPEAVPGVVAPPEPTAPPHAEPLPRPTPQMQVGVFASASRPDVAAQPPRQLQPTNFAAPVAIAPDLKLKATPTGAFDLSHDAAARPGTDKPKGTVAGAGFDQAAAASTPATQRVTAVAGGGFDTQRSAAGAVTRAQAVRQSGFGDARPAEAPVSAAAGTAVATTPVEVLFKPTPGYTDEAMSRAIQGDVVLEVEFSASGTLRVIRVVRGLGYGLDDLAVRAASQIRFKPALESGRPVDIKTNVVIVFRLS